MRNLHFALRVLVLAVLVAVTAPKQAGLSRLHHMQKVATDNSTTVYRAVLVNVSSSAHRLAPFSFSEEWNSTQRAAHATDFCERAAIPRFDCAQRLEAHMEQLVAEQSQPHSQPDKLCDSSSELTTKPAYQEDTGTSTSMRTAVYFVHLHKSGGTEVCNIAKRNLLTDSTNNCNPETQEDIQQLLGNVSEQESFLLHQMARGRSFVANEYSVPKTLAGGFSRHHTDLRVVYLTMVREPTSRYFSHFRQAIRQLQFALTRRTSNDFTGAIVESPSDGYVSEPLIQHKGTHPSTWRIWTEREPPEWMTANFALATKRRDDIATHQDVNQGAGHVTTTHSEAWEVGRAFLGWLWSAPDNLQFRTLCGSECAGVGRGGLTYQHFEYVRNQLDQNFAVVGVLEAFDLSMSLFARTLSRHGIPWRDSTDRWRPPRKEASTRDTSNANTTTKTGWLWEPTTMSSLNSLMERIGDDELVTNISDALRALTMWDQFVYDYARARLEQVAVNTFGSVVFRSFFQSRLFFDDVLQLRPSATSKPWDGSRWQYTNQPPQLDVTTDFDRVCNNSCCGACGPLGGWFESVVRRSACSCFILKCSS